MPHIYAVCDTCGANCYLVDGQDKQYCKRHNATRKKILLESRRRYLATEEGRTKIYAINKAYRDRKKASAGLDSPIEE